MAPARRKRSDPGELGYNFSWPVAFVLVVAMLLVGGGWLGLVFARIISVDSWKPIVSHAVMLLGGAGLLPLGKFYRRKRIDFKISPSDPPEGPDSGEDSNNDNP